MQWKINRGRHTDHLAGRHPIRTNQCPPPPEHKKLKLNLHQHSSLRTAHMCVHIIVHNRRTQHSAEQHILILWTTIIAQMISTGGDGATDRDNWPNIIGLNSSHGSQVQRRRHFCTTQCVYNMTQCHSHFYNG